MSEQEQPIPPLSRRITDAEIAETLRRQRANAKEHDTLALLDAALKDREGKE